MPYRKNADENAPSRKYFSAASCDSSRRRRASPHIKYSGSESTSSATNIVSRSFGRGEEHHPAEGEHASAGTSRFGDAGLVALLARRCPGSADACGVNASRPLARDSRRSTFGADRGARRSARRRGSPTSSSVPCRNSAGRRRPRRPPRRSARADADPRPTITTATKAATRPPEAQHELRRVTHCRVAGRPRRARPRRRRRTR